MRKGKKGCIYALLFVLLFCGVTDKALAGSLLETLTGKKYNETPQLTEEDIRIMNDGDVDFVYNEDGYLTFLRGKYYEKKIEDHEDAVLSLNGIASLIGLSEGSEFFAVYGSEDPNGYVYYLFKQRYGDVTMQNASLRVIVDPQGYAAGLSCSFTPNVGIAPENPYAIDKEDAIRIVKETYPNETFVFYEEYSRQMAVTLNDISYHVWAVYTNNPQSIQTGNDRPYIEHLVAYEGSYLMNAPVASMTDSMSGDDTQQTYAENFFEGLEPETYFGSVRLHNGRIRTITVPVAYSPREGIYYLADLERKIMVADYYSLYYENEYSILSSKDNKGWKETALLAYESYCAAYDYFAEKGINSVDGMGMPILVLAGYCDENKNPILNASFLGFYSGWAVFVSSDSGNYGECLDVQAHEFTHAVTGYSMGGCYYANEQGAINEAYSDIFGNLCELSMGRGDGERWLIAEDSGNAIRSMSSPGDYGQPEFVGDRYYCPPTNYPDYAANDFGGVHTNSSLLSQAAYKLWEKGISLDDQFSLWLTSIEMMTPLSGYDDVHAALLFSCEINGFSEQYRQYITEIFEDAGLLGE